MGQKLLIIAILQVKLKKPEVFEGRSGSVQVVSNGQGKFHGSQDLAYFAHVEIVIAKSKTLLVHILYVSLYFQKN